MVSVHLPYGVRGTVGEDIVQILDFVSPVPMGALLTIGEHEGFARVEQPVNDMEAGLLAGDLEDSRQP